MGRDFLAADSQATGKRFNPRARVGRDKSILMRQSRRIGFNPRARVGRDAVSCRPSAEYRSFQSTRPRGARLVVCSGLLIPLDVSIHAPAWGATPRPCRSWQGTGRFNPRARVGRDQWPPPPRARRCRFQSTRPRGARQGSRAMAVRNFSFQSTRPRGARLVSQSPNIREGLFQSTRPRGARPTASHEGHARN